MFKEQEFKWKKNRIETNSNLILLFFYLIREHGYNPTKSNYFLFVASNRSLASFILAARYGEPPKARVEF